MATRSQAYSALEILRSDIGDVLDAPYDREKLFKAFLEGLQISGIKAGDFECVIVGGHFPRGSSYYGGQVFGGTAELYATLSSTQKHELREYYFSKLNSISPEFPELRIAFEEQLH